MATIEHHHNCITLKTGGDDLDININDKFDYDRLDNRVIENETFYFWYSIKYLPVSLGFFIMKSDSMLKNITLEYKQIEEMEKFIHLGQLKSIKKKIERIHSI